MSKPDTSAGRTIIVYGSAFAREPPRMTEMQARELVLKAIGEEREKVEQLTCTRDPAEMLDDAIDRAEAMLPHGIECLFERDVACCAFRVYGQCPHCGTRNEVSWFTDDAVCDVISVDALAALIVQGVKQVKAKCVDATCCDPIDRMVDGLTVRECLVRYEQMQRADFGQGSATNGWYCMSFPTRPLLTAAQKDAARLAWSSELKRKQAEVAERERNEVCVDDDRWEP